MGAITHTHAPRPLVAAHRGASRMAPENTLVALQRALERGARAIELDVQMTADGHLVVFHDAVLDRTTNGHGWLRQHTLDELRRLDAGSWYGEAFRGERVPRFAEALDLLKHRAFVNIELKPNTCGDVGLEAKTAQIVRDLGLERDVVFTSFDHLAIRRLKQIAPRMAALVTLGARLVDELDYVRRVGADGSNHSLAWWTPELVDAYHASGFIVHGSLSNDPRAVAYARTVGVDLVDSDDPVLYGDPPA